MADDTIPCTGNPQVLPLPGMGGWILTSGIIQSGYGTMSFGSSAHHGGRNCNKCGKLLSRGEYQVPLGIIVQGVPDQSGYTDSRYCWECAQFSPEEGFVAREKWIKESVPLFCSGMPAIILADYLEDQGRDKDAEWLRTNRSGS